MADSIAHTPATIADVGKVFSIGDKWRCQCGIEHNFGAYMAAHWDEEMLHTCKCGAGRTFLSGEVIE